MRLGYPSLSFSVFETVSFILGREPNIAHLCNSTKSFLLRAQNNEDGDFCCFNV